MDDNWDLGPFVIFCVIMHTISMLIQAYAHLKNLEVNEKFLKLGEEDHKRRYNNK